MPRAAATGVLACTACATTAAMSSSAFSSARLPGARLRGEEQILDETQQALGVAVDHLEPVQLRGRAAPP